MKIEELIRTCCAGNEISVTSGGGSSAVFRCGETAMLDFGRMKIDGFSEAQGLPEKLRRHAANDGLSVEADSCNVIPFGCEYRVKRQWKFAGNTGELTDDIAADNGGKIDDLSLEEILAVDRETRIRAREVKL